MSTTTSQTFDGANIFTDLVSLGEVEVSWNSKAGEFYFSVVDYLEYPGKSISELFDRPEFWKSLTAHIEKVKKITFGHCIEFNIPNNPPCEPYDVHRRSRCSNMSDYKFLRKLKDVVGPEVHGVMLDAEGGEYSYLHTGGRAVTYDLYYERDMMGVYPSDECESIPLTKADGTPIKKIEYGPSLTDEEIMSIGKSRK